MTLQGSTSANTALAAVVVEKAPLTVTRSAGGYLLEIDPSFTADTSRFSVSVLALSDTFAVTPLAIPSAFQSLARQSPTSTATLLIPGSVIEGALKGLQSSAIGIRFKVSESSAGADGVVEADEMDYLFPQPLELSAQFEAKPGLDPAPGATLLLDLNPPESILGTEKIGIIAEVYKPASGEGSSALRAQQLIGLPAVLVIPERTAYSIDGALLKKSLDAVVLQADEAVRLRIFIDLNADGLLASNEAATTIAYPSPPPMEFSIAVSDGEVAEGSTVVFTVTVADITSLAVGSEIRYTLSGMGVTAGDIGSGSLSGTFKLDARGEARIPVSIANDVIAEAAEELVFTLAATEDAVSVIVQDAGLVVRLGSNAFAFAKWPQRSLSGGPGNDSAEVFLSGGLIDGGDGLDTIFYRRPQSTFLTSATSEGFEVLANPGTSDETQDLFKNVERLLFVHPQDVSQTRGLALDIKGSAGVVAKILATVFGAEAVNNEVYAGIGLDLLDRGGYNYESLMKLALEVALGGDFGSPEKVVDRLYTNVVGTRPSDEEAAPFVAMLREGEGRGEYAAAAARLGVFAAEFNADATDNIDLVGLADTGLRYVPVPNYGS